MANLYSPKKFKSLRIFKNPKQGVYKHKRINNFYNSVIARSYGHTNWRCIESGRRTLTKQLKRKVRVWVKIRLTQPVTSKPKQSRMGKGKGKFKGWIGYVRPGMPMYETGFVTANALEQSSDINSIFTKKLPFEKIQQKFPFPVEIFKKSYKYDFSSKDNSSLKTGLRKYKKKEFNYFKEFYIKKDSEEEKKRKKKRKFTKRKFKKIRLKKEKKNKNKIFFFKLKINLNLFFKKNINII